jgi:hypothetical protein
VSADDSRRRAMCLHELAQTNYLRAQQVAASARPDPQKYASVLREALRIAQEAELCALPQQVQERAQIYHLLGNILDDTNAVQLRLIAGEYYEKSIKLFDQLENLVESAKGCREMARLKLKSGAFDDAIIFAEEAVRRSQRIGGEAGQASILMSQQLLMQIRQIQLLNQGGAKQ